MAGTYAGQFVMEGFFNIKLPVWKRVLVTRSIAILPAISVAFISNLDSLDTQLNIL
jgi:natural resistance-associated macrophage protein